MKIFVLDDEIHTTRKRILNALTSHDLSIAASVDEALEEFTTNSPYDLLLLDHDMHGFYESPSHDDTGSGFLRQLLKQTDWHSTPLPKVILHSQNEVGRANMRFLLEEAGVDVEEHYYSPSYINHLETLTCAD